MVTFEERQALRDAHDLAIGRIVTAWNEYQEELGELYGNLFSRRDWKLAMASWHALENDRAQRAMLAAAAKRKLKSNSRALKEILWLVKATDGMISDQRNTGIHMPLMSFTDADGSHRMLPLAMFGHNRALRMVGKDLLREFAHYYSQIKQMRSLATAVMFNITPRSRRKGKVAWPKRPSLSANALSTISGNS